MTLGLAAQVTAARCPNERQGRSQDVKNEEAVQGVWGQNAPAGSRGGVPVGDLGGEESFQNSLN